MAKIAYLLMIALLQLSEAYKMLVVFPFGAKSHGILGNGYVRLLLEAGHEVTYATPFPTNKTNAKYHEVDLSENVKIFNSGLFTLKAIVNKERDKLKLVTRLIALTKSSLKTENLIKFLSDTKQEFDVIIVDWFYTEIYAGLAPLYNCPLIWSSSLEPHSLVLQLVHETLNPSFNTDMFSAMIPPYSFYERTTNLFRMKAYEAIKFFYINPNSKVIYEENFTPLFAKRGRQLPPFEEAMYNGRLLLTNSHSSVNQPISVPLNVKEIGGYHIDPNVKPLPANLQKLMDEAKHGVIYFGMGTQVKSKDWPEELKREFLQVFAGLKQTVLWKFEEQLPNLPKNVHILDWAPQPSILAHPNIRLFITHGGLLSTTETIYFGVPTIVMPYGADQRVNALRAVNRGYAKMVNLSYEMAGHMKDAIEEMLANPKYSEKAKELSSLYHDRPVSPGAELVHWVEHAVRTRGAPHLRSPALVLPWYQKMYADLLAVLILALYVTKIVIKILYCKIKSSLGLSKAPDTKMKTETNENSETAKLPIYQVKSLRGR